MLNLILILFIKSFNNCNHPEKIINYKLVFKHKKTIKGTQYF